jgi:glycosyltransferase involved in cell wall biosynthesis
MLNFFDSGGGAAIASRRILTRLRQEGIDVLLGVIEKKSFDADVILLNKSSFFDRFGFCRIIKKIFKKVLPYIKRLFIFYFQTTNPILHSTNKRTLIDIDFINNSDHDIIHLHWVNNDMISIEDVAKIKKPIVWTMHDTWVFCGAEHYPNVLEKDIRFIDGYTKKNKPKTTSGSDICRKTWERKNECWKDIKFNFISPSNYEKESFDKSALFRNSQSSCTVIPNIVPENVFNCV